MNKKVSPLWLIAAVVIILAIVGAFVGPRQAAVDVPPGFSAWDGSNASVIAQLKKKLNDPASFEHVKTTYTRTPNDVVVLMEYRAKNAMSAVVLDHCKAICDSNGEFVRWGE